MFLDEIDALAPRRCRRSRNPVHRRENLYR
nr:hypothetical protein [Mycobacterium lepromatosis]